MLFAFVLRYGVILGPWKAKRESHVVTQLDILESACPPLAVQDAELVFIRKSHKSNFSINVIWLRSSNSLTTLSS